MTSPTKSSAVNHTVTLGDRVPVAVSGDGNCLFNALSMALVGTEELAIASELRVLKNMH